jgi:hypothetical protein
LWAVQASSHSLSQAVRPRPKVMTAPGSPRSATQVETGASPVGDVTARRDPGMNGYQGGAGGAGKVFRVAQCAEVAR